MRGLGCEQRWCNTLLIAAVLVTGLTTSVLAQLELPGDVPDLGFGLGKRKKAPVPTFSVSLTPAQGSVARLQPGGKVSLSISMQIPPDHYISSTTSPGGQKTVITFSRTAGLKAIGKPAADREPKKVKVPEFGNKVVEKFYKGVVWTQAFEIQDGASLEAVSVAGSVEYQICGEGDGGVCRQLNYEFDVSLAEAGAGNPDDEAEATDLAPPDDMSPPADHENAASGDFDPPPSVSLPFENAPDVEWGKTSFEHTIRSRGKTVQVATWSLEIEPREPNAGDRVTLRLKGDLGPGWHLYTRNQGKDESGNGPVRTAVELLAQVVPGSTGFTPVPLRNATRPHEELSDAFDNLTVRSYEGTAVWSTSMIVPKSGVIEFVGHVAYQMCNEKACLPMTGFRVRGNIAAGKAAVVSFSPGMSDAQAQEFVASQAEVDEPVVDPAPMTFDGSAPKPVDSSKTSRNEATKRSQELAVVPPGNQGNQGGSGKPPARIGGGASSKAANAAESPAGDAGELQVVNSNKPSRIDKSRGVFRFIVQAVIAGFLALLTPCVFPMVPITVSFFHKQAEKQKSSSVLLAITYCCGIIGTFTVLGFAISALFGAAKLNELANNPWLNLFIGGLLIFFGCNLLGMFEIVIPSWLLTMTSRGESAGGYVGALFMALTFTLTSFTCTFAFAGILLVEAASGDWFWPLIGLLAFSAAFSLPFFFLALFPSLLKRLPKSGGWMNVVKVMMGLFEIGAALKFLGVADQMFNPEPLILTYSGMLVGWMVISLVTALYLLGLFRMPHDTPTESIPALRLLMACGFLGLSVYLTVGVFVPERMTGIVGQMIVSLATPHAETGEGEFGPYVEHNGVKYALDFERAMKYAAEKKKPVLLDITGWNCANCRYNEKYVLGTPEISQRLREMVCISLFTDKVPSVSAGTAERLRQTNLAVQKWFDDASLPGYAVVPPNPNLISTPIEQTLLSVLSGKTNVSEFSAFLDAGLKRYETVAKSSATVAAKAAP